jgi:hypothetical protein
MSEKKEKILESWEIKLSTRASQTTPKLLKIITNIPSNNLVVFAGWYTFTTTNQIKESIDNELKNNSEFLGRHYTTKPVYNIK